MKFRVLLILSLCLLALFGARAGDAATVNGLRIGSHPGQMRIVVELSGSTEFRAFVTADPWRIMVDMPSFGWKVGRIAKPTGSGVTGIRQGKLKGNTSRIAIDLAKPAVIQSAFMIPATGKTPDRLVIDYKYVTATVARADLGHVFGKVKGAPDITPSAPALAILPADGNPDPIDEKPARGKTEETTAPTLKQADTAPAPAASQRGKPLVVIDPGHGGIDPGALGANGIYEKVVSLGMAKALKKALEDTGKYRVLLTRENDTYLKLHERVAFARKRKADMFVSIHADSVNRPSVRGASIYTLSEKASDAQTAKLAARENKADLIGGVDISNEDEQVANILVDLVRRDNQNQSKFLANVAVKSMKSGGFRLLENPHRFAGFAVLKAPDIPSVLIELGFMSNAQESAQLSNAGHRAKIAEAIAEGIDSYFAHIGRVSD